MEIDDVFLYDCNRKSRQQGRLVVTATHLTFQPAIASGRKVSFPLHIILETRAVSHPGSPLKIEATVLVSDQEQPARIALEFGDRQQERDAALLALRRASAPGSVEAIRATLRPEPQVPKDDVVCDVMLQREGDPETARMVLGVESLSFEPGGAGAAGSAEGVTVALTQLTRIKSSDEQIAAAPESWSGAGVSSMLNGAMMRFSFREPTAPRPPQIELRIAVSQDVRASKVTWVIEFATAAERDRLIVDMQARWTAARSKHNGPSSPPQGASRLVSFAGISTSIANVVPERVEIVSMYKTDQGAKGRFVVECFAGGSTWQVIKRYSEFHALRESLLRTAQAPIDEVAFPAKTWWSNIDQDMADRREALEPWLNQVIEVCSPAAAGMSADDPADPLGGSFNASSGGGRADMFLPSPAAPVAALDPSTPGMDYSAASGRFDPRTSATADPHLRAASLLLSQFFSVEDVMESPGRGLTRAAGVVSRPRAGTVDLQWPADPTDSAAAVEAVLPALPCGVNCELLHQLGGGPAKAGWMYLEKRLPGIGTRWGWVKRWFVVWPQTAHPKHGHLLFYFESESSRSAEGAIQLVAPVIRAPKSDRDQYYSMRLNASQIRGVSMRPGEADLSLADLDTFDSKFILGQTRVKSNIGTASYRADRRQDDSNESTLPEHGIEEWIHTLRNAGPEWRVREQEVSRSDWLLKRGGTLGVSMWQRRWVELRGLEMMCYETAGDHPSGCWNVADYTLCLPVLPNAHRDREFILVPTSAWTDGEDGSGEAATTGAAHIFCAPSNDSYLAWRKALGNAGAGIATAEQLAKLPSIVGQWGVLASLGQSFGGLGSAASIGQSMGSPEDFDVMKLVGQGGFGKVFLVKRRGEEESLENLLAMKVMDKAQILDNNQETHIKEELSILAEMDHPFIITLEQAFHTSAKLYLVFEFMPGGDLYVTAQGRDDGKYTEEESVFVVAEVTLAIGHLHDCGIAFRDL